MITSNRAKKILRKVGLFFLEVAVTMVVVVYPFWVHFSKKQSSDIKDYQKFANVLKEENVSAWIHGHYGTDPHAKNMRVDRWGTVFINDATILDGNSLLFIFKNGQKKVTVKSRHHREEEWNNQAEKFSFTLDQPFQYSKEELRVWVWSDSQPNRPADWKKLEEAVLDADKNMKPDIAFALGDIVACGRPENYKQYKKTVSKSRLDFKNFYELAGNHEFCCGEKGQPISRLSKVRQQGNGEKDPFCGYQDYIEERLHYTLKKGNVLFIFMSHEGPPHGEIITDEVFQWWQDTIKNSKNLNIITLTHQPLRGTTRGTRFDLISFFYLLPDLAKTAVGSFQK